MTIQTEPRHAEQHQEESIMGIVIRILTVLAVRKRFILSVTLLLMTITAISVSFVRNYFRAEAVILPPQQQQSTLAALSSGMLGGAAGIAGSSIASQLGLKDPADFYIGILKSHTISENLIVQLHLQAVYQSKSLSETRAVLMKHVSFHKSKESFIVITVEDRDPALATTLANGFVEQLHAQTSKLAITDAAQRRVFFEQELNKEKNAVADAETELKTSQQKTGLIVPGGQAETLIRAAAQLRADIASREVALESLRSYATDQNSRVQVLQREIAAARGELAQLNGNNKRQASLEVSAGQLPEASLEYLRKVRELKYHETLYELLAKQYEAARLDEAREAPLLQVLDPATLPEKKAGPARLATVLLVGLLGAVLSSILVYTAAIAEAHLSQPEQAGHWAALRSALRVF